METIVRELASVIKKKALDLSSAAAHIGCSPEDLNGWLHGDGQPSAFFLQVLPGAVEDLSRLYSDAAGRK